MTQPDWAEIIAQMTPEQQQEVRRIADKLTYILTHDRMIFDGMTRDPDRTIAFRKYGEAEKANVDDLMYIGPLDRMIIELRGGDVMT